MIWSRSVLALVFATLIPVPDDLPNPLAWRFVVGQAFYQEARTRTTQVMTVAGQRVEQSQEQTFVYRFEPIKKDGDRWVVRQTVEAVKIRMVIGGNVIAYDSNADAAGPPANDMERIFRALAGAEFVATLRGDGTVESVAGLREVVNKMAEGNKELASTLAASMEEAVRQSVNPMLGITPAKPKGVGEKWSRTDELGLGPVGSYESRRNFRYARQTGDRAEIAFTTEVRLLPPAARPGDPAVPFKIQKADIRASNDPEANVGTAVINTRTGQLELSVARHKFGGTLTVEIGGQETTVTLEQDQTTEVKTFATNPARPPK